jgi:hypothetical protein
MSTSSLPHQNAALIPAVNRAPQRLGHFCVLAGSQLLIWSTLAAALNTLVPVTLTTRVFWTQDYVWLLAAALLLMVCAWLVVPRLAAWISARLARPRHTALCLGAFAAAGIAGAYAVTHGFQLSGDEMMADFDATILRTGQLIAPVSVFWRPFDRALVPNFLRPVSDGAGLVSDYLPGNAALRALVGLVASPDWTSPLLAGLAVLALFRVTRRLWPAQPEPVVVAVLVLTTSSQMLVTASTSFAMTAHMAINLVWLWLFLRDDRIGHAGAIVAGFIGTGLHQIVFHPLFAAPFILQLLLRRRWRLSAVYVGAYAAICTFWVAYPGIVLAGIAAPADQTMATAGPHFLAHVTNMVETFTLALNLELTLDNLLRLLAWQNVMIVPLLIVSLAAVYRGDGLARPLAAGVVLTTLVPFILMPWQGNGWGYRYLHGCLGNLALLAGYGWLNLTAHSDSEQRDRACSLLAIATAFSVLVLLPVHLLQVQRNEAPYRAAEAAIRGAPTDVVLVDPTGILFANDLVRNDPFLRDRPKVLTLTYLDDAQIATLCSRFSVSVFDQQQDSALGLPPIPDQPEQYARKLAAKRALMRHLGCDHPIAVSASQHQGIARP